MANKFELTSETKLWHGRTLYRIRALASFGIVVEGELGGWVEKEENLSQDGDAWVSGSARVFGDAQVSGSAWVFGSAWVSGSARVFGDAQVSGSARVSGDAQVSGSARVFGSAWVSGSARVFGDAWVFGSARVEKPSDYLTIGPIGSEDGVFTAYRLEDGGIQCNRGCFHGTIDDFADAVGWTHGDNAYGQQYQAVIVLVRLCFGLSISAEASAEAENE